MTKQSTSPRLDGRRGVDPNETANLDSAWRRFRNELDARLVERFGVAFEDADGRDSDPAVLADLALQRALMP